MITFILPWPPSVNHYWQACGHRRFIAKAGLEFRERVLACVGEMYEPFTGNVSLRIEAYPPDKRKRDLDNILKAILDSLEYAGVYESDNQVAELYVVRRHSLKPGKITITIAHLT